MKAIRRGCGYRQAGGIYSVCPSSPLGEPLENFLVDPPRKLDPTAVGLSPIGPVMLPRPGGVDILDWVGSGYYPNVADFLEETRRLGMSRRLPKNLDFSLLGPGSRHLLVHSKAWVSNAEEWYSWWRKHFGERHWPCPKRFPEHCSMLMEEPCAHIWWIDVEGGTPQLNAQHGEITRQIGDVVYAAQSRPAEIGEPNYALALFAAFPIARLEIVRDELADTHETALQQAGRARLPVLVCNE